MQEFQCSVDLCNEDGIVGWIIDTNNPHEPLEIEIIIDEEVVATTTADVFRPDLLDAGFGDGGHGFNVAMPDKFFDGKEHLAVIKEISTGLLFVEHSQYFTLPIRYNIVSALDKCDEHGIRGWIVNTNNPNEPIEIEVIIDEETIKQVPANIFRQDLLDKGFGNGKHGFNVAIPDKFFDGKEHIAIIKEISTGLFLWEYSKNFTLAPKHAIVAALDVCNEHGIIGWIADKNNPNESVEVEIIIDGEKIKQIIADIFRQGLLDTGFGDGKHGFHVLIPDKFFDDKEHTATIKEISTGLSLWKYSKNFKLAPRHAIKCTLDVCNEHGIIGWIADKNNPNQSVEIEIAIDKEVIIETTANIFRQDLANIGFVSGKHGFRVSVPDKFFDGIEHEVEIRDKQNLYSCVKKLIVKKKLIGIIENFTEDGVVQGWAALRGNFKRHLTVKILFNDECIAVTEACRFRADVKAAGIGNGDHVFKVKLPKDIAKKIRTNGGELSLLCDECNLSDVKPLIIHATERVNKSEALNHYIANLVDLIDLELLQNQDDLTDANEISRDQIFERLGSTDTQRKFWGQTPNISPYVNYTMFRFRMGHFVGSGTLAYNQTMQWYLRHYATNRGKYKIPLSANDIKYYNEPINQPLINNFISQASFHYSNLIAMPIDQSLNDANHYRLFVYKWAVEVAPRLNVEDCLVPTAYIDNLKKVSFSKRIDYFPLCNFAEIYYHHALPENIRAQLDLNDIEGIDRGIFYAIILLNSFTRPEFNRYIPFSIHEAIFKQWQDQDLIFQTVIEAVRDFGLSSFAMQKAELVLQKTVFKNAMLQLGYSVDREQSLSITKYGNRIHAAKLPLPKKPEKLFDVQIIGPFAKASGLGQACRLSADTLRAAGFSVNCVDFGLDNPALEGYSTKAEYDELSYARINLIHLNAESIPLAFAYLPDVFTNSYNLGYFFWELDSPAACHYLALKLLDEVWVSSKYTREIYVPHTQIPVTNVGMTIETLKNLDKQSCRRYVENVLNLKHNEVVFLTIFDSFSFVQRKNPIAVVRSFQQAFTNNESVRLVIKTQNRFYVEDPVQIKIWSELDSLIAGDTRIKVINQTIQYDDLLRLKCGCDVYVSLHRSEGWGFGMIEAMNLHVPVICTAYSGNMDFCTTETAWLVDYTLIPLKHDDYIFVVPGQQWAEPSIDTAAKYMQEAYLHPELRTLKAKSAYKYIQQNFSLTAIAQRYATRVKQIFKMQKIGEKN
jgi:glycosyltransferase involved in cell wall biosynthesis